MGFEIFTVYVVLRTLKCSRWRRKTIQTIHRLICLGLIIRTAKYCGRMICAGSGDGRIGVHALFFDFRKAFDLVDHGILLRKLAEMNVSKCFWLWTRSFLEGRSQQVNLGGALSSTMPCPLGVPQGSVSITNIVQCPRERFWRLYPWSPKHQHL